MIILIPLSFSHSILSPMSQKQGAVSRPGLGHCTFEILLSGPACISFNIVCMCVLNTANSKLVLHSAD